MVPRPRPLMLFSVVQAAVCLAAWGWTSAGRAQTASSQRSGWAGVRVLPKDGCLVRDAKGGPVDDAATPHPDRLLAPYAVVEAGPGDDAFGDRLYVAGGTRAWVPRKGVVGMGEAEAYYTFLIQNEAKPVWSRRMRALAYVEAGAFKKAAADLDAAVALAPEDPLPAIGRGAVRIFLGELDGALQDLDRGVRLDRNFAPAYAYRAAAWFAKKEFEKGLSDLNQAIKLDHRYVWAYVRRGAAHRSLKQFDRALDDYAAALKLDAGDPEIHHDRGEAWMGLLQFDRAIDDFTAAIRLQPQAAASYQRRADALRGAKSFDKALEDYAVALRLAPNDPVIYAARGGAWMSKRATREAIQDFDKAVALAPDDARLRMGRALAKQMQGDFAEALVDFEKATELSPADPVLFLARGQALADRREYAKALSDLKRAADLAPEDVSALNAAAWLLATAPDESLRDGAKAFSMAKKANDLSYGRNGGVLDTLAAACAETGDFDAAVRYQEEALKLLPRPAAEPSRSRLSLYRERKPYRLE